MGSQSMSVQSEARDIQKIRGSVGQRCHLLGNQESRKHIARFTQGRGSQDRQGKY